MLPTTVIFNYFTDSREYESIIENNEIKNAVWVSRDKCHVHRLFAGSNIYNTTEWRLKSSIVYTISGKGLCKHYGGKKSSWNNPTATIFLGGTRTPDLRLLSPLPYPTGLLGH